MERVYTLCFILLCSVISDNGEWEQGHENYWNTAAFVIDEMKSDELICFLLSSAGLLDFFSNSLS